METNCQCHSKRLKYDQNTNNSTQNTTPKTEDLNKRTTQTPGVLPDPILLYQKPILTTYVSSVILEAKKLTETVYHYIQVQEKIR